MRWAEHVAGMRREEVYRGFWCGNLREKDHLGDSGLNGRIILRWIFRKWVVGLWTGSNWLIFQFDGKMRLYGKIMAVWPL